MENVIWKYHIERTVPIRMPKDAKILTVQNQNDRICIWVLVNSKAEKEERHFEVHGTGNVIFENNKVTREYIGTCQTGIFVWHIFEVIYN